jgi:hypothetical protein
MEKCEFYKITRVGNLPSKVPPLTIERLYCDLSFEDNPYRRPRNGDPISAPQPKCNGDIEKCDQPKYRKMYG